MIDYKALVADLRDAEQANWKRLSLDAAAAIEDLIESVHIRDKISDELNHYIWKLEAEVKRLKECNDELREAQTYIDHYGDKWMTSAKDVPTSAYNHGYMDGKNEAEADHYEHTVKDYWKREITAEELEKLKKLPVGPITPIKIEPIKPHWVSVEDSMPDLLQFVLVCNDEGKCVVAQYVGYQTDSTTPWRIAYSMYDTDAYFEADEGPVCYWMPIPETMQK